MRHPARIMSGFILVAFVTSGWFLYGQNSDQTVKPVVVEKEQDKNSATREGTAPAADEEEDEDQRSIRKSAEEFVKAYNAHDAKILAGLFVEKAQYIDEDGDLIDGREAIERSFSEFFSESPEAKIEIKPKTIRLLTPNLAVESGDVRATPHVEKHVCHCTYSAVHTKIDGRWQLVSIRDFHDSSDDSDNADDEQTPGDRLQELAWMIGDWVDESPDATVRSHVRWDDNEKFLLNDFVAYIAGEIALQGQMRIGWDPLTQQFKGWVFDSEGGYTEGLWIHEGNAWVVKWQGATSDGDSATSTSIYRQIDDDTIGWRSIDRVIAGDLTDPVEEIIVKRQPPLPGEWPEQDQNKTSQRD